MVKLNHDERGILKSMLKTELRLDNRKFTEHRNYKIKTQDLPQYDANINISLGHSELELYFRFNETVEADDHEKFFFDDVFFIKDKLEKMLRTFKLGSTVEFKIINNDGSLLSLFYTAFYTILRKIKLPRISDSHKSIKNKNDNPIFNIDDKDYFLEVQGMTATTYALMDNICITDPSLAEEETLDASITVLSLNNDKVESLFLFSKEGVSIQYFKDFLTNKIFN